MKNYEELTIESRRAEFRTIVGPMHLADDVRESLYADDWVVTRTGPYTDPAMFPRVDPTRFLIRAERSLI